MQTRGGRSIVNISSAARHMTFPAQRAAMSARLITARPLITRMPMASRYICPAPFRLISSRASYGPQLPLAGSCQPPSGEARL